MKSLKVHRPLLEIVCRALDEIFENKSYADKEVPKILKNNRQLGSRDRSFIAETIYDVVRWKRNYEAALTPETRAFKWEAIVYLCLVNNENYSIQNPDVFNPAILSLQHVKVDFDGRKSFPDWIDQRCSKELNGSWNEIAKGLNQKARVYMRANRLKTDAEGLLKTLLDKNIEAVAHPMIRIGNKQIATPDCVEVLTKNNLKNTPFYDLGLFEFQDIGSQAIGSFCEAENDTEVLDLCAGGGGKTLHLSAIMQNQGKLYATDFDQKRTEQLQKRLAIAGCKNIKILPFKAANNLNNLDLVLIDAPCSGLGTFRRSPDQKWKLQEKALTTYNRIQSDLIFRSKFKVKPGGKIVYATCSILPSEGEIQIQRFLSRNRDFELKKELRLSPHQYDGDGFYMAMLVKK